MTTIYILKLTHNKYYIGKTNNLEKRIYQHFSNKGSQWTKRHAPLRVLKVIPDCQPEDEDKYTLIYMRRFGIRNVRGGSFSEIYFSNTTKKILQKMINTNSNRCYVCNSLNHFRSECPY